MYQIGDLVVYGNTGVCRVTDIVKGNASHELSCLERGREYYLLQPLYQAGTIFTPTENGKVFMRPIITADEAEKLIDNIPNIRAEAFHTHNLQELKAHYHAATQTHQCEDLIELTMSIYAKKQMLEQQKRKCGQVDSRYMKQAEDMLYGEFAVALGIAKDAVAPYIANRVGGFLSTEAE